LSAADIVPTDIIAPRHADPLQRRRRHHIITILRCRQLRLFMSAIAIIIICWCRRAVAIFYAALTDCHIMPLPADTPLRRRWLVLLLLLMPRGHYGATTPRRQPAPVLPLAIATFTYDFARVIRHWQLVYAKPTKAMKRQESCRCSCRAPQPQSFFATAISTGCHFSCNALFICRFHCISFDKLTEHKDFILNWVSKNWFLMFFFIEWFLEGLKIITYYSICPFKVILMPTCFCVLATKIIII
jgi:hypothetical protein